MAARSLDPQEAWELLERGRSKMTLRNGAAEVAGGFAAWERAGLPVEKTD